MIDSYGRINFYQDYELYQRGDGTSNQHSIDLPDATLISAFPTPHFGAYMQSFASCGDCSIDMSSYSFSEFGGSLDSDGSFRILNESPVDTPLPRPIQTLDTSQVSLFWKRYNEYPQFLKKLKKRNRRKAKKQARPTN
jgi:hypothetical protein